MFHIKSGECLKSVGGKGEGKLQFNTPTSIAVHPTGMVIIADSKNYRIQVLFPDLSFSHMFGSQGNEPGQFNGSTYVTCGINNGTVYVVDNHRIQLFSIEGEFIATFGSQLAFLDCPRGICVDSTNRVYVTDGNNRVSVFIQDDPQHIKSFRGTGMKDDFHSTTGIAVNSTGNLYVCDYGNNNVVVLHVDTLFKP